MALRTASLLATRSLSRVGTHGARVVPRVNNTASRTTSRAFILGSARSYSSYSGSQAQSKNYLPYWMGAAGALGVGLAAYQLSDLKKAQAYDTNWEEVRKEIATLLDNENYDDGSYGPVLVRLAWHASGTYSAFSRDGGSNGATMRFCPESKHGANAGLAVARDLLEPIKRRHPEISYADLWTLAGCVAIEEMGGPKIHWRPGRTDAQTGDACPPDGRLPDASQGQDHVRAIFYRMGFSDREIVALVGAHALGRCHKDRSGYDGPWTRAPTTFSTEFFRELLENKWTLRKWNGPAQYTDPTGELMMLPADMAFVRDPEFKKFVEMYAANEDLWFADFAQAWTKLIELGVEFPEEQKKKCPLNLWAQLQHLLGKK